MQAVVFVRLCPVGLLTVHWTVLCGCDCPSAYSRERALLVPRDVPCHRRFARCALTSRVLRHLLPGLEVAMSAGFTPFSHPAFTSASLAWTWQDWPQPFPPPSVSVLFSGTPSPGSCLSVCGQSSPSGRWPECELHPPLAS